VKLPFRGVAPLHWSPPCEQIQWRTPAKRKKGGRQRPPSSVHRPGRQIRADCDVRALALYPFRTARAHARVSNTSSPIHSESRSEAIQCCYPGRVCGSLLTLCSAASPSLTTAQSRDFPFRLAKACKPTALGQNSGAILTLTQNALFIERPHHAALHQNFTFNDHRMGAPA
jgi:hypothetical protein